MNYIKKQDHFITVKGVDGNIKVLVTKSSHKTEKENTWYTNDSNSKIGEDVVIENTIGARVTAKRIS